MMCVESNIAVISTVVSAIATCIVAYFTKLNIDLSKENTKLVNELKEHHISNIAATIYSASPPTTSFKLNDFKSIRSQIKYTEIFVEEK